MWTANQQSAKAFINKMRQSQETFVTTLNVYQVKYRGYRMKYGIDYFKRSFSFIHRGKANNLSLYSKFRQFTSSTKKKNKEDNKVENRLRSQNSSHSPLLLSEERAWMTVSTISLPIHTEAPFPCLPFVCSLASWHTCILRPVCLIQ